MEEQIKVRIAELEKYREELVAQANAELNRISGGIAELKRLLEQPAEQTQEAGSGA